MKPQAFLFTGVSPQVAPCSACTCGLEMYRYHLYAQSVFFDLEDSIHVSSQLVAPSFAISSALSAEPTQYFLIRGRCFLSSATVAANCFAFSSYGSLIPSPGCVFIRYSAASAIWIGLSGIVNR